ncbi:MAG: SDR family oxidoreductase [Solirubrobacterales bacterium]|nr:SDR family oxidoreductase [Solirubrobacterales bacterium]
MALPDPTPTTTALVTGASSGIGQAIARRLAARGHGVTLVARREDELRALAAELADEHGIRAEVVPCDLADPAARDRLAAELDRLGLEVDVLVNNAGFGTYVTFAEADREREVEQVRLNVEAVTDLTARYFPAMVRRGRGAVLVTASTAAFQPLPGNAAYAASKAFALSFTEALHAEAAGSGVTVTVLCPGPVATGFQDASGAHEFAGKVPKALWRSADQVADAAMQALDRGRRVVVPGLPNRIGAALGRFSPRPVVLKVMGAG